MRICVHGAGAVGSQLAIRDANAATEVTVVADAIAGVVQETGKLWPVPTPMLDILLAPVRRRAGPPGLHP
jgi:ketopantoate reductase